MPDDPMAAVRLQRHADDYQRTRPAVPAPAQDHETGRMVTQLTALISEQHAASADRRDHAAKAAAAATAARRAWHAEQAAAAQARTIALGPQIDQLRAIIRTRTHG